jgi:putative endonuclease
MVRSRKSKHLLTGVRGESLAVWYLRLTGYRILERNFRCRMGEIDVIAIKRGLLVFVEVRTRGPGSMQHPIETVDTLKVARTIGAARTYLCRFVPSLPPCRFDIVGITAGSRFPLSHFRHIKGAFDTSFPEYRDGCRREIGRKRRWFQGRRKKETTIETGRSNHQSRGLDHG